MIVQNTKYFRDLAFEDYLKMPGTSFSSLKDQIIIPSEGMKLGTRVHNYLLEPDKYDWQQVEIVKMIANAMRRYIGDAIAYLEKEIAFTAEFVYNGLIMLYKGRADMLRVGRIVIDLKVLAGSLKQAIERFGYREQVSGYCLATGSSLGLIIAFNKSTKQVEIEMIRPNVNFWQYHTVSRGLPIEKYLKSQSYEQNNLLYQSHRLQ